MQHIFWVSEKRKSSFKERWQTILFVTFYFAVFFQRFSFFPVFCSSYNPWILTIFNFRSTLPKKEVSSMKKQQKNPEKTTTKTTKNNKNKQTKQISSPSCHGVWNPGGRSQQWKEKIFQVLFLLGLSHAEVTVNLWWKFSLLWQPQDVTHVQTRGICHELYFPFLASMHGYL